MSSDQERLAMLEEHKANTSKAIDAIFLYMKEGRDWREETGKCLAVLVKNQEGMASYQVVCDKERTGLDKRITEVEGFQKRSLRVALYLGGAMGFLISHGDKIYKGIKEIFS